MYSHSSKQRLEAQFSVCYLSRFSKVVDFHVFRSGSGYKEASRVMMMVSWDEDAH